MANQSQLRGPSSCTVRSRDSPCYDLHLVSCTNLWMLLNNLSIDTHSNASMVDCTSATIVPVVEDPRSSAGHISSFGRAQCRVYEVQAQTVPTWAAAYPCIGRLPHCPFPDLQLNVESCITAPSLAAARSSIYESHYYQHGPQPRRDCRRVECKLAPRIPWSDAHRL